MCPWWESLIMLTIKASTRVWTQRRPSSSLLEQTSKALLKWIRLTASRRVWDMGHSETLNLSCLTRLTFMLLIKILSQYSRMWRGRLLSLTGTIFRLMSTIIWRIRLQHLLESLDKLTIKRVRQSMPSMRWSALYQSKLTVCITLTWWEMSQPQTRGEETMKLTSLLDLDSLSWEAGRQLGIKATLSLPDSTFTTTMMIILNSSSTLSSLTNSKKW